MWVVKTVGSHGPGLTPRLEKSTESSRPRARSRPYHWDCSKGVTFFNSGFKSDPIELFPSTILVIAGEKRFPPPNFNLKIVRIQRGNGSWMLLDAILHY
jgi:hypothetical protein